MKSGVSLGSDGRPRNPQNAEHAAYAGVTVTPHFSSRVTITGGDDGQAADLIDPA